MPSVRGSFSRVGACAAAALLTLACGEDDAGLARNPAPRMSGLVDTLQPPGLTNITVANCDDKTPRFVSSLAGPRARLLSLDGVHPSPFGQRA